MGKHIIIKEARCSFPQLYSTEVKEGGDTFGPGIALVLEKEAHADTIKEVMTEMRAAIAGNEKLKKSPPTAGNLCLRKPDPEREELQYLPGNLILKANCPKPPVVLEPDGKTIMTAATDKIYSGCYVNAKVEIWGQTSHSSKRVNAKLIAVQFNPKPADSFDGSYVSPEEAVKGFDSLDDNMGDLGADLLGGEDLDEDNLLGD